MTNYLLFTPLIIDDAMSLIIGPLLKGYLPKMLLVSKRLRALYEPSLQYALRDPVNARLQAVLAQEVLALEVPTLILALTQPEPTRRVFYHRDTLGAEELPLAYDVLVMVVLPPPPQPDQAPRPPMVIGAIDVNRMSIVVKVCNFHCALEHVDTFQSRDCIPEYDGAGEDPQDRSDTCFGNSDVDDPNPLVNRSHIERWLVLKLNGRRWVGVYTSYDEADAENHKCMFAFQRTPKGAYSALLLVRDIISHYHPDICPPIPPLFRE
jgi:hypothetical protein